MVAVKTHYLDASVIVKLFVEEDKAKRIRDYYYENSNFYTTSLCFAEALGVLKKKKMGGLLSKQEYMSASQDLCISIFGCSIDIDDISIATPQAFKEAERIATEHNIDLIDAFQIYTLGQGVLSVLRGDSRPILITADRKQAIAAEKEGFRSWNIMKSDRP